MINRRIFTKNSDQLVLQWYFLHVVSSIDRALFCRKLPCDIFIRSVFICNTISILYIFSWCPSNAIIKLQNEQIHQRYGHSNVENHQKGTFTKWFGCISQIPFDFTNLLNFAKIFLLFWDVSWIIRTTAVCIRVGTCIYCTGVGSNFRWWKNQYAQSGWVKGKRIEIQLGLTDAYNWCSYCRMYTSSTRIKAHGNNIDIFHTKLCCMCLFHIRAAIFSGPVVVFCR